MPRQPFHTLDLAILARTIPARVPRAQPFRGLLPSLSRMAAIIQWSWLHLKDGLSALSPPFCWSEYTFRREFIQA